MSDLFIGKQLWSALLRHKFIIIVLLTILVGGILMMTHERWRAPAFVRDLGSALLTAGVIGGAVEFYTRHEFRSLVVAELKEVVETSGLTARVNALESLPAKVDALGENVEALHQLVPLSTAIAQQGIRRIHPNRHGIDFRAVIEGCQPGEQIRLLGVCMADFANQLMYDLLRKKLGQGCSVRLLILNPDSTFAGHHTSGGSLNETRATKTKIRSTNDLHADFIEDLSPELRPRIELGHYDSPPHVLLVGTGSVVIVSFYLRGATGEWFPHIEMRNRPDGICSPFVEHFDSLWESRLEARGNAQAAD
jgi:hypothetical protein